MSFLLNPWTILGVLLASLGLAVGGFLEGRKFEEGIAARANLVAEQAFQQAYEAQAGRYNVAAAKLEEAKAKRRVVERTITKEVDRVVEKPVYRNVCLDADGLRVANDALAGEVSADPAQPHAAVPAAHAAR